jgi:hypothetical protein
MFETSPKLKKTAASAVAAGALLLGAETAQAHPVPAENTAAALAGPNAVGAVAAGYDPVEKHHHFMSPGLTQRLQTDPARGYEGGKGADLGIEGKGGPGDGLLGNGGEAPQKSGAPSGPGPRGRLYENL